LLKGDIALRIPPNISFEEAATLPGGLGNTGLALYRHLELPFPTLPIEETRKDGRSILIYGGSTATATMVVQFAKL
jgi:NADPH:quinone reductase-like Zn-dependent oxidoreductase